MIKHIWDILYLYKINVYLSPPAYVYYNARKNFINKKFCQFIALLKNTTKNISIKNYSSIKLIEKYHVVLDQVFKIIMVDLNSFINKETIFAIAVKAVKNTTSFNSLVSTLSVFRAYLHINNKDLLVTSII